MSTTVSPMTHAEILRPLAAALARVFDSAADVSVVTREVQMRGRDIDHDPISWYWIEIQYFYGDTTEVIYTEPENEWQWGWYGRYRLPIGTKPGQQPTVDEIAERIHSTRDEWGREPGIQ